MKGNDFSAKKAHLVSALTTLEPTKVSTLGVKPLLPFHAWLFQGFKTDLIYMECGLSVPNDPRLLETDERKQLLCQKSSSGSGSYNTRAY